MTAFIVDVLEDGPSHDMVQHHPLSLHSLLADKRMVVLSQGLDLCSCFIVGQQTTVFGGKYLEIFHHMHARTHTHRRAFRVSTVRPTMTACSAGDNGRRCFIQINTREGDPVSRGFVCFLHIKKLLGRTETRTCDRMCFQTI